MLFSLIIIILISCQKVGDDCSGMASPAVTVNSPVQAGGTINLTAGTINGAEYYFWTGPNGFTSNEQDPIINNVQSDNAGKYQLKVGITGGCVKTATTDSVVITVAAAPCTPNNNTASLAGVATLSLSPAFGAPSGGSYFIEAGGTNGDVELEFPGTSKPVPGVYAIRPLAGQWLAGDVRLRAVSQDSNWPASSGKVYVTVSNNKVTATFCSVPVTGQTVTLSTTLTGKLTER
jgi:hypothetical protein